jgi:aspartate carbamoyltransferase catalytic subunit
MNLKTKDLLGLRDLTAEEIEHILDTAKTMKYILTTNNKKKERIMCSRKLKIDEIIKGILRYYRLKNE